MGDATRILQQLEAGHAAVSEQLFPIVYDELRRLASERMAGESPGITLQATALVHEAYIRLVDVEQAQQWQSRGHFFAAAGEAMRRILVEHARRKGRVKRGGGRKREPLAAADIAAPASLPDILDLDDALNSLEQEDSQAANIVKLHHFAGLTMDEVAELLGVSARTVYRDWAFARVWLFQRLGGGD
ncbi:MAG: sigma-70 family RNA polymerase sigma factor [Planctomycetales bacterium]|nr:sigma-70 family RNA polymerase sigma factor [Planctomycetales bacterium]